MAVIILHKIKKHLTKTRAAAPTSYSCAHVHIQFSYWSCLICRVIVGSRSQHVDLCVALWEMSSVFPINVQIAVSPASRLVLPLGELLTQD